MRLEQLPPGYQEVFTEPMSRPAPPSTPWQGTRNSSSSARCGRRQGLSKQEVVFGNIYLKYTSKCRNTYIAGALNGILSSRETSDASIPMIVTHSSGNHGQAVAWAARHCQIPCTVVVPRGTPKVKVRATPIYTYMCLVKPPQSQSDTVFEALPNRNRFCFNPYL